MKLITPVETYVNCNTDLINVCLVLFIVLTHSTCIQIASLLFLLLLLLGSEDHRAL